MHSCDRSSQRAPLHSRGHCLPCSRVRSWNVDRSRHPLAPSPSWLLHLGGVRMTALRMPLFTFVAYSSLVRACRGVVQTTGASRRSAEKCRARAACVTCRPSRADSRTASASARSPSLPRRPRRRKSLTASVVLAVSYGRCLSTTKSVAVLVRPPSGAAQCYD